MCLLFFRLCYQHTCMLQVVNNHYFRKTKSYYKRGYLDTFNGKFLGLKSTICSLNKDVFVEPRLELSLAVIKNCNC